MLDDTSEETKGGSDTPAVHYFFDITEYKTNISHTYTDIFHNIVAQLQYLSNRALTDIQIAVYFL